MHERHVWGEKEELFLFPLHLLKSCVISCRWLCISFVHTPALSSFLAIKIFYPGASSSSSHWKTERGEYRDSEVREQRTLIMEMRGERAREKDREKGNYENGNTQKEGRERTDPLPSDDHTQDAKTKVRASLHHTNPFLSSRVWMSLLRRWKNRSLMPWYG